MARREDVELVKPLKRHFASRVTIDQEPVHKSRRVNGGDSGVNPIFTMGTKFLSFKCANICQRMTPW